MAGYAEIYMEQGADFENIITLTDDRTNANLNLSNCIVTTRMWRYWGVANSTANINSDITDTDNGVITMSLPNANTRNIEHGRYVFSTIVNFGDTGTVTRVLEGVIFVTPG
jgi:hypothetical protein